MMGTAVAPRLDTRKTPAPTGYALSPMQAGMLFQYVSAGPRAGYDVEQIHIATAERLEAEPLARAWTLVARRHPVLSTAFRWDDAPEPLQVPWRDVSVPVGVVDWTDAGAEELERRRAALLARDRVRGFDLARAPLMRVTLARTTFGSELLWTFHHIVLDGRSFAPVLREVFAAYAALREGRACLLPAPPPPYGEYIRWLARADARPGLAYFAELLAGKTAPTPLPCAEPAARPLDREGYGEVRRVVDPAVTQAARAAVERSATTMGTLVQAAWALVLARLTGEDDVLFGTVRAGRRSALDGRAQSMIGLFINTLPVRVQVAGQASAAELLASVRAQTLRTRAFEHASLVDVQGASSIPRGTPLFETLLMFEDRELNRVLRASDASWDQRVCTVHEQPSPPLTICVVDDGLLEIRALYDRRRFHDPAVERVAGYVEAAVAALAGGDDRRVDDLDVLPAGERHRLLVEWNDTARPFPDHACIHHGFEEQARRRPDAVALEMDGASLTFGQLDGRADRIATALRARGAGPGAFVGVCLRRGLDLVAALLGVAKSGAAFVPLDPEHPAERLAYMLEDAGVRLVVTDDARRSFGCEAMRLGPGHELEAALDARISRAGAAPPRDAIATDPCYVIFTSGSTGRPKGVLLTHRAVVNTFDWVSRSLEVGPGDRLLFVTSPCFDLSVYDTFGALGAGATVVVASSARLGDPQSLAAALVEERITVWDSAPAALQRLVPFFPPEAEDAPLRLVMLSGDWIPLALPDQVRQSFRRARVVSLGGATEAAIWSNWFPIGAIDPRWTSIPYGRPIQNARYHVLDRRRQPVPIGVPGDLYIGGACLAERYVNRPDLTSERFVDDPFQPGERLYATGDRARRFEDGELEFLGRADFQVKIRGYRVELGEVEAAIASAPEVREVVCTAATDASGQRSLVAHVIPRDGVAPDELDERAIRAHAARKLPEFMVPSHVVALARWPLTPNGKVDRQALPSPGARRSAGAFVEPRTPLERELASIWRELLRRDAISVTDSFYALGGHSLLAVMLMVRIQRQLGVRISLSTLVEAPTIAELAATIAASEARPTSSAAPPPRGHALSMNRRGARPPIVLVSGAGGFGLIFRGLARHLGRDQPLYALNAVGSEEESEGTDHTIEEIAAIYEREILAACPSGPLVLGGYSFGILVAFEVARRLRAMGRPVPLLCSFDGFAPGYPKLLPLRERLALHFEAVTSKTRAERDAYLGDRLRNVRRRILSLAGHPEYAFDAPATADAQTALRLKRVAAGLWRARDRYKPAGKLACDLLLVRTSIRTRWEATECDDPSYGWGEFVDGRIQIETVPGEHLAMFDGKNDRAIAEILARALGSAFRPGWKGTPAD